MYLPRRLNWCSTPYTVHDVAMCSSRRDGGCTRQDEIRNRSGEGTRSGRKRVDRYADCFSKRRVHVYFTMFLDLATGRFQSRNWLHYQANELCKISQIALHWRYVHTSSTSNIMYSSHHTWMHLRNERLVRKRHTIRDRAIRLRAVLAKTSIFVLRLFQTGALDLQERAELAPSVVTHAASWEGRSHR
jgi:hypothetical protein